MEQAIINELTHLDGILEQNGNNSKILWDFRHIQSKKEREIVALKSNPFQMALAKQVGSVLRGAVGTKGQNRNHTANQVRIALSREQPLRIVKSDIKDFFSSIPAQELLDKLSRDSRIDSVTCILCEKFITDYKSYCMRRNAPCNGLPQGVSLSSYLAEYYLSILDQEWTKQNSELLYARFVDDIIIIAPETSDGEKLLDKLIRDLNNLSLNINKDKTINKCSDGRDNKKFSFEFLGYRFVREYQESGKNKLTLKPVKVSLTNRKVQKLKGQIKKSLQSYRRKVNAHSSKVDRKYRQLQKRLLISRLTYLTGNTRIVKDRREIMVGIYFSYPSQAYNIDQLEELDRFLQQQINTRITVGDGEALLRSLRKLSFAKGYTERRFKSFSSHELARISSVWS